MRKYRLIIGILSLVILIQLGIIVKLYLSIKKQKVVVKPTYKAKIAIVLDDWGYNLDNLEILNQINYPLTLAILPHLKYSQDIANYASSFHKEIILHLPLQPKSSKEYAGWEKNTITVDMPEAEIQDILLKALESLKDIRGLSNHMGSRATEDERVMTIIFKELKKRELYFLDNKVSLNSVCSKVAKKLSLKFIIRDIFLDNQKNSHYIKSQLKKLKFIALKKGQAVGVGHADRTTLEVLKKEMPSLEKEGFKFVFLSELVR